MVDARIEGSRGTEPRTAKIGGPAIATARSADENTQGFSSLLASLDHLAVTGLQQMNVPDDKANSANAALTGQEALLGAQIHAPWMSLVGQTTQLDTQSDADLRLGVATDFLSGRGRAVLLEQRQALQGNDAGQADAHAPFVAVDADSNRPQVPVDNAQAAISIDDSAFAQKANTSHDGKKLQSALQALDEPGVGLRQLDAQSPKPATAPHISLQGMTAVLPQVMAGLKDLLHGVRQGQAGSNAESAVDSAQSQSAHTAATAIHASTGAAHAGMQGGGHSSTGFDQSSPNQAALPDERAQQVSEQVAFWVHQKTQNASLSIEHQGKPIEVQVQLNGQQAHIRFAAGDEQARLLLGSEQSQLRELLQAQGLELSGVSVDARSAGQDTGARDGAERGQARTARVSIEADGGPLAASPMTGAARAGVDLFV